MKNLLIISNRLPVKLRVDDGEIAVSHSLGGLATGLKSIYKFYNSKWLGWPGLNLENQPESLKREAVQRLDSDNCMPVFLTEEDNKLFYSGFSNKTIWPLFHYFPQYTEFRKQFWDGYVRVNRKFAEMTLAINTDFDAVWIHDYHLMLLPGMIKAERPNLDIGFFLHIPFPSQELFRVLPWRLEILEGLLGADLIGFHTYDYARHFLSCVRRLLGHDILYNQIKLEDRLVQADVFPMGIDYDRFHKAAKNRKDKNGRYKSKIGRELEAHHRRTPKERLILSIDRLDYSKGIPHRLTAFEYFLETYPQYRNIITLVLLAVPSRINVEQYQEMKSEIDQIVGRINGRFGTINWTPVQYINRPMPFENLIELYSACHIALLTPVRDGMNLVSKEYIACRTDGTGVLILSELAGAAKELVEAIIINPHNVEEIGAAMKEAIEMPESVQRSRNRIMQRRLHRYNVEKWARDFLERLGKMKVLKEKLLAKRINKAVFDSIAETYRKAAKRVLFLDYDGTLVGFQKEPQAAVPDEEVYSTLDRLARDPKNEIVLISGRDRDTFDNWFQNKHYTLIVEHGVWYKKSGEWEQAEQFHDEWKPLIRPVLDLFADRTPGAFIEEKNYSLVWHYRKADPDLGMQAAMELKDDLTELIAGHNLEILEGNKVLEVKNSGVNKGIAAMRLVSQNHFDFILGIGDDYTDEYLFEELPPEAVTIRVGLVNTYARYCVKSFSDVRGYLKALAAL